MQARLFLVQWLTDFGDQAVVLPVSCVVLLFLRFGRWRRGVLAWAATIVGTLGVMLVLKLGIGAYGWRLGTDQLNSPSGHTASATVLYGNLLSILWRRIGLSTTLLGACMIAVAFAASRLILHDHTVPEVVVGAVVGIGATLVFRLLAGPVPHRLRRGWMVVAILVVMAFFHGHRLPAEQQIHAFATTRLRAWLCPALR